VYLIQQQKRAVLL